MFINIGNNEIIKDNVLIKYKIILDNNLIWIKIFYIVQMTIHYYCVLSRLIKKKLHRLYYCSDCI